MKIKVSCLVIALIMCMFCLSSCGGKQYKFKYDDAITWGAKEKDIVAKYGSPDSIDESSLEDGTTFKYLKYENRKICGYDGFRLVFTFLKSKNELFSVFIEKTMQSDIALNEYNDIVNALTLKYGEPTTSQNSQQLGSRSRNIYWKNIEGETDIQATISYMSMIATYEIVLSYDNIQLNTKRNANGI